MKVNLGGSKPMTFLLHLTVLVGVCTACSPPSEWQSLPVSARADASNVEVVFLGNVTHVTPPRFIRFFRAQVYSAEVSVGCVYKKIAGLNVYEDVTVVGFGESQDCTNTEVEPAQQYIFLAKPYEDGYAIVEYNVQLGAEPATEENIQDMEATYGCEGPSEPTTPPPTTTPVTTTRPPTTVTPTDSITTQPISNDDDNSGTLVSSCTFLLLSSAVFALKTFH